LPQLLDLGLHLQQRVAMEAVDAFPAIGCRDDQKATYIRRFVPAQPKMHGCGTKINDMPHLPDYGLRVGGRQFAELLDHARSDLGQSLAPRALLVGQAQGQSLAECLDHRGAADPGVVHVDLLLAVDHNPPVQRRCQLALLVGTLSAFALPLLPCLSRERVGLLAGLTGDRRLAAWRDVQLNQAGSRRGA
jgi:hypothetical protein